MSRIMAVCSSRDPDLSPTPALEVRPETRPRHLGARWSECARAAKHRSTRISNAHARSTEGPGAGGPHPGPPRSLLHGVDRRHRSGQAFRLHL